MRAPSTGFRVGAVLVASLLVAFAALVLYVSRRTTHAAAERSGAVAERLFADLEVADVEKLSATLDALSANAEIVRAFRARDRDRLLELAAPLFRELSQRYRITHWYFILPEPERTCLLRVHWPDLGGDRVERTTLQLAMQREGFASGKELGKTAFALRAVRPVRDEDGLVGYMELGEEIDHFLGRLKDLTGDDYALLLAKRHLDRAEWARLRARNFDEDDWDVAADYVTVNATSPSAKKEVALDGEVDALPDGGRILDEISREGRSFVRAVTPVRDAAGRKVGALFMLHDVTAIRRGIGMGSWSVVGVVLAATALAAGAVAWLLRVLVFAPPRRGEERAGDVSERRAGAGRPLDS